MGTAAIAAVAALLGVALGRLWDGRAETARWRRDQTMAAYQGLSEAFRASYDDIQTIAFADPTDPDYAITVRTIITTGNHRWHDAATAIWIHGAPATITAAAALGRELTTLHTDAATTRFTAERWALARVPARRAFETYLGTVRQALHLTPVPDAFYDDGSPEPGTA
ncbi:hypothetical protein [Nocardia concava]|uniref:hypothetical protein n=1 Tax=Nocardia concava TaxID=257281 RepID=UPI0003103AF3|nr:hypothetical protein [Nocardia concava]